MKGRIFLIHWNEAEAEAQATALRAEGWEVEVEAVDGGRACQRIETQPPQAVVIFLTRLPSHGRETAQALREAAATRRLPILFVGGHEEAIDRTRARVPEAVYTSAAELAGALERVAG